VLNENLNGDAARKVGTQYEWTGRVEVKNSWFKLGTQKLRKMRGQTSSIRTIRDSDFRKQTLFKPLHHAAADGVFQKTRISSAILTFRGWWL